MALVNVTQPSWSIHHLWHHCRSWFDDSSVAWAIGVHVETLALDGLDVQQHVE